MNCWTMARPCRWSIRNEWSKNPANFAEGSNVDDGDLIFVPEFMASFKHQISSISMGKDHHKEFFCIDFFRDDIQLENFQRTMQGGIAFWIIWVEPENGSLKVEKFLVSKESGS